MSNTASNPHKAVLNIRLEIHPVNKFGECSGHPVKLSDHPDFSLKSSMLLSIDGFDLNDCLTKLRRKLDEFKK